MTVRKSPERKRKKSKEARVHYDDEATMKPQQDYGQSDGYLKEEVEKLHKMFDVLRHTVERMKHEKPVERTPHHEPLERVREVVHERSHSQDDSRIRELEQSLGDLHSETVNNLTKFKEEVDERLNHLPKGEKGEDHSKTFKK